MKNALKIFALIVAMLALSLALFSCSEESEPVKTEKKSEEKAEPFDDPSKTITALKSNGYSIAKAEGTEDDDFSIIITAINNNDNDSLKRDRVTISYYKHKIAADIAYREAIAELERLKTSHIGYGSYEVGRRDNVIWLGASKAIEAASIIDYEALADEEETAYVVSWGPDSPYFDEYIAASSENQLERPIASEVVVPQPETTITLEVIETQIEIDGNPDITTSITTANDPYLESIDCTVDHTGIASAIDHTTYPYQGIN